MSRSARKKKPAASSAAEIIWKLPQAQNMCFGHEQAEEIFAQAEKLGRMPHAWIFHGLRGIGKATLAHKLARIYLAKELPASVRRENGEFDFAHYFWRQYSAGIFPNMRIISLDEQSTTKEIGIEEIRETAPLLHLSAAANKRRVVIIDAIEDLSTEATNALLKWLEEPPADFLFLLITHKFGSLLPTIPSRCQRLRIKPVSPEITARVLKNILPNNFETALKWMELAPGQPGILARLLQKNLLPLIEELFAFPSADSKLQALYNLALRAATQKSAAAWSLWMEVVDVWFLHLLRRKSGVSCNLSSLPILQNKPVPEDFLARFSLEQLQEIWEKSRATLGDVSRIYLDPQHAMLACFADFTKK